MDSAEEGKLGEPKPQPPSETPNPTNQPPDPPEIVIVRSLADKDGEDEVRSEGGSLAISIPPEVPSSKSPDLPYIVNSPDISPPSGTTDLHDTPTSQSTEISGHFQPDIIIAASRKDNHDDDDTSKDNPAPKQPFRIRHPLEPDFIVEGSSKDNVKDDDTNNDENSSHDTTDPIPEQPERIRHPLEQDIIVEASSEDRDSNSESDSARADEEAIQILEEESVETESEEGSQAEQEPEPNLPPVVKKTRKEACAKYCGRSSIISHIIWITIITYFLKPVVVNVFNAWAYPEETKTYLLSVGSCRIPILYDGESELSFLWKLDLIKNRNLSQLDLTCRGGSEYFSKVETEKEGIKLYLQRNFSNQNCCLSHITRPEIMSNDSYLTERFCQEDWQWNGTVLPNSTEFLVMRCENPENKTVELNAHVLIPDKPSAQKKVDHWKDFPDERRLPYSVAVFVLANTSRNHAYRSLPRTTKLLESLWGGFTTMKGYQSMQDSELGLANPNILPLVAGLSHLASFENVELYDTIPLLWDYFTEENYVTLLLDDSRNMLRTTKGSAAFLKQPTDYYLKPFLDGYLDAFEEEFGADGNATGGEKNKNCVAKQSMTSVLLEYMLKFKRKFGKTPTFTFAYLSWPQQQHGLESLSRMDDLYYDFFEEFLRIEQVYKHTAIFVLGDHGGMDHPYFDTEHGAIEKYSPYLTIRPPNHLWDKEPSASRNLRLNVHRLTTTIDVHRTIALFHRFAHRENGKYKAKNVTYMKYSEVEETWIRLYNTPWGENLFIAEVPYDRVCADAGIDKSVCLCNKTVPSKFNGETLKSDKYWTHESS